MSLRFAMLPHMKRQWRRTMRNCERCQTDGRLQAAKNLAATVERLSGETLVWVPRQNGKTESRQGGP